MIIPPYERHDHAQWARRFQAQPCYILKMRPWLLALLMVSSSGPVRAGADPLAEGKEHFRRGTHEYDLGNFLEAAAEYEAAFRITDRPGLLFNIGQAYRLGGRPRQALAAYQGFLRRVPEAPQRGEVEEHLTELERRIAEEDAHAAAERSVAPKPTPAPEVVAPAPVSPAAESRPPRKRTWVWGVAAAGVVAAGLAIGLGVGLGLPPSAPHADRTVSGF
jgi:tetratricopeptide (TPR) repeat protein